MTDSCSGMFAIMTLAVLMLACAGTAAGATWVVDDDDGGADFTSMPTVGAAA